MELVPPRGYDLATIVAKSRSSASAASSAINIPDGPRASSRISPLITADRIQQEAGIETVLHFCCRDRNLIGMQADLLACAACGIRNLLFVTGDPPKLGDYPARHRRVRRRFDRHGRPCSGGSTAASTWAASRSIRTPFAVIGVGLDPTALDRKREIDRFRQKIEAGAEFAITQPVFDPDALLRILDEVQPHGIPIIAGIWPLVSYRNALFMRNEVPGVVVPDAVWNGWPR